jgi:hypothetical protein
MLSSTFVSALEIWAQILVVLLHFSPTIPMDMAVDILIDGFMRDRFLWMIEVKPTGNLFW